MNIEGFIYRLSHDCHLDIDHNVSIAYCRSSSGNSVVLLNTTICTNTVVSDFVRSKALLELLEEENQLFLQQSVVVAIAFSLQRS